MIKHFLGGLYPPHETKNAISAIKSGEITLLQRVDTLLKPQRYTGDYIDIVKELAHASFATLDDPDESWHEIVEQIQAGDVDVSNIELPEKIKRESELFEHLINFYLTFMGRLFVGRGDNGYTRYAYRSFISQLLFSIPHQMQTHSLSYYGSLLRLYATNVMYYKSFYKKTKETTKSFDYLASSLQHLYANAFTIDMLHEHAIATTLSDLTPKHRRLVVPQAEIIESFKSSFGETIHEQISSDALLTTVYQPVLEPLTSAAQLRPLRTQLHEQTTPDSITALKNALYTPDFQIRHHAITQPRNQPHHHSNRSHLLMASTLRETLRGALILYDNIDNDHHRTQIASWYEYCVMHIAGTTYLADSSLLLPSLAHHYASLLTQRRQIDENASYTTLISTILSTQHDEDDTISTPTPKEHLRLLNITKHMTYYNKRYCIPSF